MKQLSAFTAVFVISFLAQLTHALLPGLPIPTPIYGILYLFSALRIGLVKLERITPAARGLLSFFPVLLIPACVGVADSFSQHPSLLFPFLVITILTTLAVLLASGWTAQLLCIRHEQRKRRP